MHWLYLFFLAAVVVGLVALGGLQPDEARPVAQTRLMTVARIVLGLLAVLLVGAIVQQLL
ncbi:MAG: hypothetical protein AAGC60_16135 [Acidobacteriota bacterium]